MPNRLETLRKEMGLSRPKFLELVGATRSQLSLFRNREVSLDPGYIERAKYLRNRYQEWEDSVLEQLDVYESRGLKDLTSYEVQETFSLRDMHILQLRFRGKLTAIRKPHSHSWFFPIADLRSLVSRNSTALEDKEAIIRGPLSFGFLRWLGKQDSLGLDLTRKLRNDLPSHSEAS